jgi:uncharacterized protein YegL
VTNKDKTLIAALLDRSGSMRGREEATQDGFDEFINGQKSEPGEALVTLAQFDDRYDIVYQNKPIAEVPPLVLQPRGMTAMNDAIGKLITSIGVELAEMAEDDRPGLVVVVIMTDGLENASKEWDTDKIRALIKNQEEQWKWKFIFLGSGIDVRKEGGQRGMRVNTSMAFDANNAMATRSAYGATSNLVSQYRGGVSAGLPEATMDSYAFSDEDRKASMGPGRQDGESDADWKSRLKGRHLTSK